MLQSIPAGGTGLLALFCNLAPQWHVEFRQWLADDMFPARRAIGFPACASYDRIEGTPQGPGTPLRPPAPHRYLTLYEAPSLGDLYGAPYQRLREHRDARDKAFHARFQDLDRATMTWVGPELVRSPGSALPSPGFAPVVVVDRLAVGSGDLPSFNRRLVDSYLPECAELAGLRRVRRYQTMECMPDDGARHLLLHEFDSATALSDPSWLALRRDLLDGPVVPTTSSGAAWLRVAGSAAG